MGGGLQGGNMLGGEKGTKNSSGEPSEKSRLLGVFVTGGGGKGRHYSLPVKGGFLGSK